LLFAWRAGTRPGAHFPRAVPDAADGAVRRLPDGDLFNLFVFFEVLLAASYGLLLHGSGPCTGAAGLHYIAINLVASRCS
jgi:multicomponent K+:H+ antiporter subunit D